METAQPNGPIIAVFGPTGNASPKTLKLADLIGYEIVKQNGIVLTGGEECDPASVIGVKEAAICGAERALRDGHRGAWIGVLPDKGGQVFDDSPDHFLIPTHLGNKRNYLEAYLCDAAIALEGGDGTKSEVTFSLSLQKPVVLIGNWTDYSLNNSDARWQRVQKAFDRVERSSSGDAMLDEMLNERKIVAGLDGAPLDRITKLMAEDQNGQEVAERAVTYAFVFLRQPQETRRKGEFPDLSFKQYHDLKDNYEAWLLRVQARL